MSRRFQKSRRKIFVWVFSLVLLSSLFAGFGLGVYAEADDFADDTVLAFTSDVHNRVDNKSAVRLDSWIDVIRSSDEYGKIDYMGFCGDTADGSKTVTGSTFWQYVGKIIDVVNDKGIRACYTTGNHEFKNGEFHLQSYNRTVEVIKSYFTVDDVPDNVYAEDNFRVYCLGTRANSDNTFKSNLYLDYQIANLKNYLDSVDNSKVIFVLTHFPLHCFNDRETKAADQVIDVLNTASQAGKKIVLLWGHDHTERDTNYNKVYKPGDIVQFAKAGDSKYIYFYYAAAGCMCDAEYNAASASITGKGLVVAVDKNSRLNWAYFDKDGKKVADYVEPGYGDENFSGEATPNSQAAKTDPGKETVKPVQPTDEEVVTVQVNDSLPVIDMEKIKTTIPEKKSTMTINIGTFKADNCQVEYRKNGVDSWSSVWTGKDGKVTIKNMKKGDLYQFRFTTFKYSSKVWTKSKTSDIYHRWIKRTSGLKCKSKSKKITVSWKKVKKASGYEVQYATDKDFQKNLKKKTVASGKKTSKVIKGLKKGKTFYVRVRAFKKKNGVKYLGAVTGAKKIKVK